MARKTARVNGAQKPRPKSQDLPGMEDRSIPALDECGEEYAAIRDQRMELTEREHALKHHVQVLMKKHGKTIYRHEGLEITVVPGEDDVKVRVKKPAAAADDDQDADGDDGTTIRQTAERRDAVDQEDKP